MYSEDITALQQRIAALPPEKRALFERLWAELWAEKISQRESPAPLIAKQYHSGDCPLSFAQERLWILHQLEPANPAYNIALLWRLDGVLNIPVLQQSFNQIVERHESLRTAFGGVDLPIQKVQSNLTLSIPIVDLQALPNLQQTHILQHLCQQTASELFDLTQAPLLRIWLLQISDHQTVLILVLHHLIADGWSRGVLLRELTALYKANLTGQSPQLAALPIQYSDFAIWQRQQDFTTSLNYWQQQLAGLQPLELPTDYLRPPISQFRSATKSLSLSPQLLAGLKTISREAGTTLFMTLLTAFKILLHRYSQQIDIAVGVPVANRHPADVESLIGFFVNTIVLRTHLSGNPSFRVLLERVRQVTASAYQHQDLPFAKLVEALHPQRHLSQNPLFQVMFQVQNQSYELQNALIPDLELPNLSLTQDWLDTGYTKFDMTWHLIERSEELLAVIEYRTDLYGSDTVVRMLGHFQVLLEAIVVNPHQNISELPILTASERQQLLIDWNQTHRDMGLNPFLPDRFEFQVAQTPDRIAVVYQDQQLTYQELDSRANQLAHYLQAQGISTESRVGICMSRSPEMMIALLGALKAGAAYVPLDPSYPTERLSWMIEDAQIDLLLTQTDISLTILSNIACRSCTLGPYLNHHWQPVASYPVYPPKRTLSGLNLAYLIYTSGSTGKPKGTMLAHAGLSNYLDWCLQTYFSGNSLSNQFGAPVQSSISFDATITSLYPPLLIGQSIVLLPEQTELESLNQALALYPFSILKLTPAHLKLLSQWQASSDLQSNPSDLRTNCQATVVIGGEALTAGHLTDWRSLAPHSQFINEYGPTETVVGCCVYTIPADLDSSRTASIPIGRPIYNTELYILDNYLQPVPIGVPGELYIGGIGVGRGYFHRPDLTAARFIPNPFLSSNASDTRLYQTGDRVRYLADGTIEYLGRIDQQVKLRGFRIELEEIAAVLEQHPLIQTATVTVNTDRLVAYVVLRTATSEQSLASPPELLTASLRQELRQFLQSQLPDYMLPSLFVSLSALPLTPHGKLDRSALPDPDIFTVPFTESSILSELEVHLMQIWSELLGVPVAINDNFFELGGDSILSLQVIARAKQVGIQLTPRQLFQYQTIAELATQVNLTPTKTESTPEQAPVTGPAPLTPIQHWLIAQQLPHPDHVNQAVLLEVVPTVSAAHLHQSLTHLWQHHDALRLRLDSSNHSSLYSDLHSNLHSVHAALETPICFTVVDLSDLPLAQQTVTVTQIAAALQASLDLSHTLWRSVLFRMGSDQPDRLLLILHHWIIDGISWRILLEDLTSIYAQIEQVQPVQLPPKTAVFRDWAAALQTQTNSATIHAELNYWLSQSPTLVLPLKDANSNMYGNTEEMQLALEMEPTRQLLEAVAKFYRARTEELLLAAFIQAMQPWLGSGTLLVALEHHGRNEHVDLDVSRTVGWFTTIAPIAFEISAQPLVDTLKQVKETLRQVPQHGLSYGLLRYLSSEAEIRTRLAQLPPAQIKFNYLGSIDLPIQPSSLFLGWAREPVGPLNSPLNPRPYWLEINAWIAQDQLHTCWVYSRPYRSTIEPVAQAYLQALTALQQPQPAPYTPSDFPAAKLNQKQLDQLMRKLQPGRSSHD